MRKIARTLRTGSIRRRRNLMATFRIKLPGRDEPRVVPLRGDRITIGRRPDNTVEIPDPTLSAHHAELVRDRGRYRLKDLGSTNGTFVEGSLITDFHLHGPCKVSFGTIECEFDPNAEAPTPRVPPFQGELDTMRKENEALKAQLDALRSQPDVARPAGLPPEIAGKFVSIEEFQKVGAEHATLLKQMKIAETQLAALREEASHSVPKMNFEEVSAERTALHEKWKASEAEVAALREALNQKVPREEFEKLVADRAALAGQIQEGELLLQKMREEFAHLRLEHEHLRTTAESARQEVERLRAIVHNGSMALGNVPLTQASEAPLAPLGPLRPIAVPRTTTHYGAAPANTSEASRTPKGGLPDAPSLGV